MNQTTSSNASSRRPSLLRSPPSIQLSTYTAHAHTNSSDLDAATNEEDNKKLQQQQSRTQHKMMLQRQSFLADDKNYLDHPDNMRRLTKEIERVNREYRCVRQFQDPFALSVQRVLLQSSTYVVYNNNLAYTTTTPATSSIASSICSSNHSQSPPKNKLQRRASSHTVHDYLLNFKEERRHSFSIFNDKSSSTGSATTPGFMNRIFFGSNQSLSPTSSQHPQQHHQFKRYPHLV